MSPITDVVPIYRPEDLRRQADALAILKQPDTAAMLRAGANALDALAEVHVKLADLVLMIDSLEKAHP